MADALGDKPRYPYRHIDQDRVKSVARATVGAAGAITFDKLGWSITDTTGTGVYTLNFPPCHGVHCRGFIVKRGGTTTLLQQIIGSDTLPSATAGTWKFNSYVLTVSAGTIALGDFVEGDVIDFHIEGKVVP